MKWGTIALILCVYGALKEFRPTEPYLYQWQHEGMGLTAEQLSIEVYPWSTYGTLVCLLPTLLLTDVLLYKPVLLLESASFVGVWLTLIFGRSVVSQQVGQVLYGLASSLEVAYFAYIYVKVEPAHFKQVTVWTRSALEFGRCVSYVLSEPLILLLPGRFQLLNWISLGSLLSTFLFALLLPNVTWREIVQRHTRREKPPASYLEFVRSRVRGLGAEVRRLFGDAAVLKWCACWALLMCGYLQCGNMIQTLWGTAQDDRKTYNGFVQGFIPIVCTSSHLSLSLPLASAGILAVLPLQHARFRWLLHDLPIAALAAVCAAFLLLICRSGSIWVMYAGYAIYRVSYQLAITITQCMIIERIDVESGGFVFGLCTFAALLLQTGVSLLVTKFVAYSIYHGVLAVLFLLLALVKGPWSDSKRTEESEEDRSSHLSLKL
ncbi:Reduced folate carrier [Aphelenchoides fujianensis]|nr:Reduced folate carrier [Aphelenchoides fujianensis]